MVHGTTIGTVSDFDGNYSITIPNYAEFLDFSYVGYLPNTVPITNSVINVNLQADVVGLEEIVVYESQYSKSDRLAGSVAGVDVTSSPKIPRNKR